MTPTTTHKNRLFCLLSLILTLSLSSCAQFQKSQLERAEVNYHKQNYHTSFTYAERMAKLGDPEAEYAVGYMYFYGQGVIENHQMAIYWMEKSAAQGYPDAQQALTALQANG